MRCFLLWSGYTLHAQPWDAWQRIPSFVAYSHYEIRWRVASTSPRHLDEAPVITLTRKRVAGGIVRAHVQNTSSLQMYYHYNTSINYISRVLRRTSSEPWGGIFPQLLTTAQVARTQCTPTGFYAQVCSSCYIMRDMHSNKVTDMRLGSESD